MLGSNAKLADYTSGWHRHPEDEGIVFTSHQDIFRAACHDVSCRAAIWKIDDTKKAQDRNKFMSTWHASSHNKPKTIILEHSTQGTYQFSYAHFYEEIGDMLGFDHTRIKTELDDLVWLHRDVSGKVHDSVYVDIIKNWRFEEGDKHDPHSCKVTNQVFCSKGTILPLNSAGEIQVEEGDVLHMGIGCPHHPEWLTDNNANTDRLTVACYG